MGYILDGVLHCDHCGLAREACSRKSKIIGTCWEYNAIPDHEVDRHFMTRKPIGMTDDEAMAKINACFSNTSEG